MWKVQLFQLNYDERESQAVKDVVDSGWITMGENTKNFEDEFAVFVGEGTNAIAVSSATAALHMALLALGIKEGDEVIIPALTFIADMNVVKIVGATPVLADIGSDSDWNMSAASIAKVMSKRTKAVILVHFAGFPCEMDAIVELCTARGIKLIEDCAHAPGAYYKDRHVGLFGDIGCFSFFTNKNLSVGEGGMFVTKDADLAQKAQYLRSHGMTALTLDRHKGHSITYDVVMPGLNYRIDEMRAALGRIQLEKLQNANALRKVLVERYVELLKEQKMVSVPLIDLPNIKPSYHIFPVLLSEKIDRVALMEAMKVRGVQTSIHYPAFKDFSAFHETGLNSAPLAEAVAVRELTLPLFPTMTLEEVELVVETLNESIGEQQ